MHATGLAGRRRIAERMSFALAVACAVTLGFVAVAASPGHLSIDEIAYHLMARDFWAWGDFTLRTGFQDVPAEAYVWPVTVAHEGRLVSQYPALHALIAWPFYALAGYRGLFLLNALAFCATVLLICALGRRLTADRVVPLAAGLIFVFATFAWDYAAAAWPHALATLLVTAALYATLRSLQAAGPRDAIAWALGAGLIAGLGIGVRVDVTFALAALVVPLLFARPVRLAAALAVGLGTLPGLAALAWINAARFGIASPFTYGRVRSGSDSDPLAYLPVVALGLAAAAVVWLATRPRGQALVRRYRWPLAGAAVVGCALLVPALWGLFARLAEGVFQLVVDLRIRDLAIAEGGLTRGPGGGMIYLGKLKKALLQSCPYLVALAVPIALVARGRRNALPLAMLLLVPAAFIGAYGYFAWHGGLSLNMRYFTPILPTTSVLTALAMQVLWRRAAGRLPAAWQAALAAGLALTAGLAAFAALGDHPIARSEFLILTPPLGLAAVTLAALLLSFAAPARLARAAARGALALTALGLAWAATIHFTYDVPTAWAKRAIGVAVSEAAMPMIEPDALLLVDSIEFFAPLYERRDLSIVEPRRDDFASFRRLVDHHLAAQRPVYGILDAASWSLLEERGLLRGVERQRLGSSLGFPVFRIEERTAGPVIDEAG